MRAVEQICRDATPAPARSAQVQRGERAARARVLTVENATVADAILGQHSGWRGERTHLE
jgi:hypothetical protein